MPKFKVETDQGTLAGFKVNAKWDVEIDYYMDGYNKPLLFPDRPSAYAFAFMINSIVDDLNARAVEA